MNVFATDAFKGNQRPAEFRRDVQGAVERVEAIPKKKLTEYEQLELKIPHYMRDKVNKMIEQQVKLRVSEHMEAFKNEISREIAD